MWKSVIAVAAGGAIGSLLRWELGKRFNTLFPLVPPGTLIANLVGAYVIGICAAAISDTLPAEWRLFFITGLCGGLTTFSTFSLEITHLLQQGRSAYALFAVSAHLVGSVIMVFAGIATVHFIRNAM